jgi:hypothetical protein
VIITELLARGATFLGDVALQPLYKPALLVDPDHKQTSELTRLSFEILPPWWRTTWFQLAAVAAVIAMLALGWNRRARRRREHQRELERLQRAIAEIPFIHAGSQIKVTASFGVVWLTAASDTAELLLSRADSALYSAKHAGRNRVEYAATG